MKKLFIIGVLLLLFPLRGFTASLTHGPVVGGIASDSAILFTRSSVSAVVDFEYSINSDLSSSTISSPVTTISGSDFTARINISGLSANTTYYYTPRIDGVRALSSPYAKFKTATTVEGDFSFIYLTDFIAGYTDPPTFTNIDAENADFAFIGGDFDHTDRDGTLADART